MNKLIHNPRALKFEQPVNYGEINFLGQHFFCDFQGSLFWPQQNCLIVSDLHLEKGVAMASLGNLVPPYDTGETLARLSQCVERWKPDTVICLGDSFHRKDSAKNLPRCYQKQLVKLMENKQWIWIAGNHDPSPPAHLGGINTDEIRIGPIRFCHEQQFDKLNKKSRTEMFDNSRGEISGHLHPVAIIQRRTKRLRRRCFAADQQRLIMPAFGTFTGGLSVRNEAFCELFDEDHLHVWMLGHQRVFKISASQLSL